MLARLLRAFVAAGALSSCGGGGDHRPPAYWQGVIRNTTNLASGATLHTCSATFPSQLACFDLEAERACRASYPFPPVPSNSTYLCVFVAN